MSQQKPRRTRAQEEKWRETVVLPLVTLPTLSAVRAPKQHEFPSVAEEADEADLSFYELDEYQDGNEEATELMARPRERTVARPLQEEQRTAGGIGSRKAVKQYNKRAHPFEVLLVPGRNLGHHMPPNLRYQVNRAMYQLEVVRRNKTLLVVLALVVVLTSTLVAVSNTSQVLNDLNQTAWETVSGEAPAPTPTPPPAPDITAAGHYVDKYGFDWPVNPQTLPAGERQRILFMLPFAYQAAAAYDRRYHNSIEPELLVWWTHAEGIAANINYSNCANNGSRPGTTYFTDIENCPDAGFWQLGYGNQFSVIYVLKNAFTDMHGDPNNTALVQKVGQWVLDYDRQQGTVPLCGGYSCTFPKMTIDQIMSGIDETPGVETADNWWASVLSRDPAINCYMIAQALSFFNHAATLNWVGCYYYEPCWGYESNSLGDILSAWPGLRAADHL